MEYLGKYSIFDPNQIKTYPVAERNNKVKWNDLILPEDVGNLNLQVDEEVDTRISKLAKDIVKAKQEGKPVVFFAGGHFVKNGLSLLVGDLLKRGVFSLIAGNGATSIHDFELGLLGETSEYVPQALEKGEFGMAFEFNFINAALTVGNNRKLGYGESIGKLFNCVEFRTEVQKELGLKEPIVFKHPEVTMQSICYKNNIPFTIHVGIGTDVLDQHPYFDGRAKGGCSGRDFLIYTEEISKLTNGGVILNVGSAVTGPEVFLKAASMVGNIGKTPKNIITANFDLRPYKPNVFSDENSVGYYFRDQKSIVKRVPEAYEGKGYYIQGNQKDTLPLLYKKLIELL